MYGGGELGAKILLNASTCNFRCQWDPGQFLTVMLA
jgi:hypothetical protein